MRISFTEHAKVRLWERYGFRITLGLRWYLGRALDVLQPPEDCVVTLSVPYRQRHLRFAFDGRHRQILTFLPEIDARPGSAA